MISKGIDKKEFLKDLKLMKRRCLKEMNYSPEDDIAYIVTKYSLERRIIWMKIRELLSIE